MMIVKEIIIGKCSSLQLISDVYGENSDWQNDYGWVDEQNTCYQYCLMSSLNIYRIKIKWCLQNRVLVLSLSMENVNNFYIKNRLQYWFLKQISDLELHEASNARFPFPPHTFCRNFHCLSPFYLWDSPYYE